MKETSQVFFTYAEALILESSGDDVGAVQLLMVRDFEVFVRRSTS